MADRHGSEAQKEMMKMINNAADGFLLMEGADPKKLTKKGKT